MSHDRIQLLSNAIQTYAWGSRSAIAELLGETPGTGPQAELWMGAHPQAPSRVRAPGGEMALDRWIARDPDRVLGPRAARRFGARLPFLLKVLAAERPLSIQAHPDRDQARAGYERENAAGIPLTAPERCYRDPNPKPELICALTTFHALNRFREVEQIVAAFESLGAPELEASVARLRRSGAPELVRFLRTLMALGDVERRAVVERAAAWSGRDAREPARRWVAHLAREHPADAGVLAPLLLNVVELAPGEAMYLPAGELHSYLHGVGIEIMASSDNVLRGGLTSKHVDAEELLRTLTFRSGPVEVLTPIPAAPGELRYDAPAEEFALSVLRLEGGHRWRAPVERSAEVLLCTEGRARLGDARGGRLDLARGASAFAPAAAGSYTVEGPGVVYRASVGPGAAEPAP